MREPIISSLCHGGGEIERIRCHFVIGLYSVANLQHPSEDPPLVRTSTRRNRSAPSLRNTQSLSCNRITEVLVTTRRLWSLRRMKGRHRKHPRAQQSTSIPQHDAPFRGSRAGSRTREMSARVP